MADRKTLINRSTVIWTLADGPDGEKRVIAPGKSVVCLDEKEEKMLLDQPRVWADADAVVPTNAKKITDLQAQIDKLTAENERLSKIVPETPQETKASKKGK